MNLPKPGDLVIASIRKTSRKSDPEWPMCNGYFIPLVESPINRPSLNTQPIISPSQFHPHPTFYGLTEINHFWSPHHSFEFSAITVEKKPKVLLVLYVLPLSSNPNRQINEQDGSPLEMWDIVFTDGKEVSFDRISSPTLKEEFKYHKTKRCWIWKVET